MRLAVVQMLPSGEHDEDLGRLLSLISSACSRGADVVVLPRIPSLAEEHPYAASVSECAPGVLVLDGAHGGEGANVVDTPLGRVVELFGDDAIDPVLHAPLKESGLDGLLLRADPESPLQAEAVLELAVAYSTSIAGLVIASAASAIDEAGDAYGGSAIVVHGEILAEAVEPDEVILSDVEPPVRLQQPVAPLPDLQMILRQRLAHHRGVKAQVEWLADLD